MHVVAPRAELLGKSGGRSPEPAFSIFFIPLVTFVFPCSFYVEYKNPELATKESLSKESPLFSSHQWVCCLRVAIFMSSD